MDQSTPLIDITSTLRCRSFVWTTTRNPKVDSLRLLLVLCCKLAMTIMMSPSPIDSSTSFSMIWKLISTRNSSNTWTWTKDMSTEAPLQLNHIPSQFSGTCCQASSLSGNKHWATSETTKGLWVNTMKRVNISLLVLQTNLQNQALEGRSSSSTSHHKLLLWKVMLYPRLPTSPKRKTRIYTLKRSIFWNLIWHKCED